MTRNICFFNTNRPWGGGEKFNHDFALLCRDAGLNVHVAAHRDGKLAERLRSTPGVRLHELTIGNLSFLNPFTQLRLARLFREQDIDTLVMALPSDLKAAAPIARRVGVRRVVYRRGIAVPVKNSLLNRWLYGRTMHRLVVNSLETKRCVLAANPHLIPEERIRLVYNGFDVQKFDQLAATPLIPQNGSEICIGNAARLTAQKGQRHLLRAARCLLDQGIQFRLLLAGTGEDEAFLKNEARHLGISQVTEFLGFVPDIKRFYASLDIFALPSLWEGFGYALVEAMAMNLPVAAFDISSNPEVIRHGTTGLLTPAGDVSALADSLARLARDADLRQSMGQAGRRHVMERFDTRQVFQQFLEALE